MSIQERVKKEEEAATAKLWGKVVTKEDLEGYENIKKAEEIERHEHGTGWQARWSGHDSYICGRGLIHHRTRDEKVDP